MQGKCSPPSLTHLLAHSPPSPDPSPHTHTYTRPCILFDSQLEEGEAAFSLLSVPFPRSTTRWNRPLSKSSLTGNRLAPNFFLLSAATHFPSIHTALTLPHILPARTGNLTGTGRRGHVVRDSMRATW